jgi:hypothetical protein
MAAGDKAFWSDVLNAIRPPVCKLVAQAIQSIPYNSAAVLQFGAGSEEIDTHNFHDTSVNASRITPTIAGYYRLTGSYVTVARGDYQNLGCVINKNGVNAGVFHRRGESTFNVLKTAYTETILACNGTGDYFELAVYQVNAAAVAANTQTGTGLASTFIAEYLGTL